MDQRLNKLSEWLEVTIEEPILQIEVASADASFRRYFRVKTHKRSLIAMDAPPAKENSDIFIQSAMALQNRGVNVPEIHAYDLNLGFILLQDFGDRTFLNELEENSDSLYCQAIDALITLQQSSLKPTTESWHPPLYDQETLQQEMSLFNQWFINKHLGKTLSKNECDVWDKTQNTLISHCLAQPQVWVHRDFHSRNLMVLENTIGVIDFQDCVIGPIGYDLASIFKDCYIEWPREQQHKWLAQYHTKAINAGVLDDQNQALEQLIEWVDFAGLQRHLKVLGIFCRLNYRDGKTHYLKDLPLVAKYVLQVLNDYAQLHDFKKHFEAYISAAI